MFPEKNLEIHIYHLKKSKELLAQKWNENCSPGPVVQPGDVGPFERGKKALNMILANTSSRKESELKDWSQWQQLAEVVKKVQVSLGGLGRHL